MKIREPNGSHFQGKRSQCVYGKPKTIGYREELTLSRKKRVEIWGIKHFTLSSEPDPIKKNNWKFARAAKHNEGALRSELTAQERTWYIIQVDNIPHGNANPEKSLFTKSLTSIEQAETTQKPQ